MRFRSALLRREFLHRTLPLGHFVDAALALVGRHRDDAISIDLLVSRGFILLLSGGVEDAHRHAAALGVDLEPRE